MFVSTYARKFKTRYIILFFVLALLVFWYAATPSVIVHYSKDGTAELHSTWDTQHRIYRERILPGQATVDTGHIFPDAEFFMVFFWWADKGFQRCIDITPTWGRKIDIYLDATGRIDIARTSPEVVTRLKQCDGEPDPFRP